jgi:fatty-acyl-CoA synthase
VVAAPDEKWGEIPAAFVVLKPGEALTGEQLCEFLAARIAKFKIPRTFEFSQTPLPKTGTGKIVKRELREMFWAGRAKRVQG